MSLPPRESSDASNTDAKHSAARRGTKRRTIGVLLDYVNFLSGGYQTHVRDALQMKADDLDLNLVFYFGRALAEPNPHSATHNRIFQLVHPATVDGLIVVSTCLAGYCGVSGISEFLQQWQYFPICSIGVEIPGIPSIIIENEAGIEQVIEHMLNAHACRRIAFIKGDPANPEAEVRFEAYRNTLARHDIAVDPNLVVTGYFSRQGGYIAMQELLARAVPLDSVVASNDNMALGAIEALHQRGTHVPGDLRVTGFDDVELARLGNPPLTTIRQPFEAIAATALQLVLEQLDSQDVQLLTVMATEFIARHSCGCADQNLARIGSPCPAPPRDPEQHLQQNAARLARELAVALRMEFRNGIAESQQLLAALQRELAGHAGSFLRTIADTLQNSREDNEHPRALHDAIAFLRSEFRWFNSSKLDDLWFESSRLINLASTTAQAIHRLKIDDNYLALLNMGEQVSAAFELQTLGRVLAKNLPALGVHTATLSRYGGTSSSELQPFVHLLDGQAQPTDLRFADYHLVPNGVGRDERNTTWLVFPLTFESQLLGVAAFEHRPDTTGYHVVRDQISAALRSIQLHNEVVEKTMLHERSVQERLATAGRMQSLSVLAGGVAHDLNNVLGPLVALPDVILSELDSWDLPARTVVDVRADIECIKGASLRAAQTIKDLLTLGRQGQVAKSVLDLNTLVRDCLSDGTFRLLQEQRDRVTVKLNLSHEPANIRGSDPHIARALTNLIKNAVEAMSGQGEVTVSVHATELLDALVGYETIEPGNYVVLSVADTGRGIAQADLSRLFEPFFSNKRHTESSGTGLGLAIVHGVVKEHDGFVDVVSTECSGTTFRLYFPRWLEKAATIKPAQEAPVVRARVMVVDDSQVQLRTARRILSHLGYEVETIESGAQAHRIFADAAGSGQTPYDLVLLDMNLNEQRDGLELFGVLRGWFPSLRAILVSGHAPNERVAKAVQQGVAWLAKPYTADELGSAVRRAMVGKDDRLHPSSHSPRRHSSGALRALRTPRRLPKR